MLSTGATRLRVSEEGEATEQRFVVPRGPSSPPVRL